MAGTVQVSHEDHSEIGRCIRCWKGGNGGSPNKKADLMGFDDRPNVGEARDARRAGPGPREVRCIGHKI